MEKMQSLFGEEKKERKPLPSFSKYLYINTGIKLSEPLALTVLLFATMLLSYLTYLIVGNIIALALTLPIILYAIYTYIETQGEKRKLAIDKQLARVLTHQSKLISAGANFQDAFKSSIDSAEEPLKSELETALRDLLMHKPPEKVFKELYERNHTAGTEQYSHVIDITAGGSAKLVKNFDKVIESIEDANIARSELEGDTHSIIMQAGLVSAMILASYIFGKNIQFFQETMQGMVGIIMGVILINACMGFWVFVQKTSVTKF